jgi:SAM-dependent methyltransferase
VSRAQSDSTPDRLFEIASQNHKAGQLAAAEQHYREALRIAPDHAKSLYWLGVLGLETGRSEFAADMIGRAVAQQRQNPDWLLNLGVAYERLGRISEAVESFRASLALRPNPLAFENLTLVYLMLGDISGAFSTLVQGFRIGVTPRMRELFMSCAVHLRASRYEPWMYDLVSRALMESWGSPLVLMRLAVSLIKRRPEIASCIARAAHAWPRRLPAAELFGSGGLGAVSTDPLLLALLPVTHIADIELERFLTAVRAALLELSARPDAPQADPGVLRFQVAMARHCFVNEYVFATTTEELNKVSGLREQVALALESGAQPQPAWIAAVASYHSLHKVIPRASALLTANWPDPLGALLLQQVREPLEETASRTTIARLTSIDDQISQQVREQYEENPYPTWVKAPPVLASAGLDQYLGARFRNGAFKPVGKGAQFDILIAGCGTGPKVAELTQRFPKATLLAIDLSCASLAYSLRKSREAGVKNVEYGQADILKVGEIGRSFDFIDACGVLHHMQDPLAGWRALLSVLRPRGVMLVALYSEIAREHLGAAAKLIQERGYRPTVDDIRRFRQELIDDPDRAAHDGVFASDDFFSTSACRDLLFHVQENRFTLPQIDAFLKSARLRMLGFDLPPALTQRYAQEFPEDRTGTNLALWDRFERQHPEAFSGMYHFLVQRDD